MTIPSAIQKQLQEKKITLTALRRQVLTALCAQPQAMGAYDLIEAISQTAGRRLSPTSVYRVLDYFQQHGLIHRLASINAYVPCSCLCNHHHMSHFLICQTCHQVAEVSHHALDQAIVKSSKAHNFAMEISVIETAGTCHACANT
ncbi:MAG: Fur family transcriptional regulator [Pseudomonadota bacterium]